MNHYDHFAYVFEAEHGQAAPMLHTDKEYDITTVGAPAHRARSGAQTCQRERRCQMVMMKMSEGGRRTSASLHVEVAMIPSVPGAQARPGNQRD